MTGSPPLETIRPAVVEDAEAVRVLLRATWRASYGAILGIDKVDEITSRWHAVDVLRRQIEDPVDRFLVAEREGEILGHAAAAARGDGELRLGRLYVSPTHQGRGIGARLLEAALEGWPGCAFVTLEVEEANVRAIGFYKRQGLTVLGEEIEDGRKQLRMGRRLP